MHSKSTSVVVDLCTPTNMHTCMAKMLSEGNSNTAIIQIISVVMGNTVTCICYAQTVDLDNPWITCTLHKPWINACAGNLWIICTYCGSTLCAIQSQAPQTKGAGHNRIEGLPSIPCRSGGCFWYPKLNLNPRSLDVGSLVLNALGWAGDNPWMVCTKQWIHSLCRTIHRWWESMICAFSSFLTSNATQNDTITHVQHTYTRRVPNLHTLTDYHEYLVVHKSEKSQLHIHSSGEHCF